MTSHPSLDEFIRYLQVSLEETNAMPDKVERQQRQWLLEAAFQEALVYQTKRAELEKLGEKAIQIVAASTPSDNPIPTRSQVLAGIGAHCTTCKASLDPELDFCPACGAHQV